MVTQGCGQVVSRQKSVPCRDDPPAQSVCNCLHIYVSSVYVCLYVCARERRDLCQHHSLGYISHNSACARVCPEQVVSRGRLRPWTSTSWPQRMWLAVVWTWEHPASLSGSTGSPSRACLKISTQTASSSLSSASLQGSSECLFVTLVCWLRRAEPERPRWWMSYTHKKRQMRQTSRSQKKYIYI